MCGLMRILAGLAFISLVACGGGSGESSTPPPPPAPSGLTYLAPLPYTLSVAIEPLAPTVTGAPTSYSIAPALPAGLAISSGTGTISGTPTALQAATSYMITAANSGGSASTTVSITVRNVAPQLAYPASVHVYATGAPVQPLVPTLAGGSVVSWQIDHPLPDGLVFDSTTGQISGLPTSVSSPATYVVTASNSGGSDTFDLEISVQSGLLVELGQVGTLEQIVYSGSRIMSRANGHVILWDAQSGAILFTTETGCPSEASCGELAALAGQTLAINRQTTFDLYSSVDGAFIAQIPQLPPPLEGEPGYLLPPHWNLSSDGSYLVNYRTSGLAAWSRSGTSLLTRTGNYRNAQIFAASGELRIAGGPAGPSILETIAMPAGMTVSTSPFIGNAATWFIDGERFLSEAGATALVYSKSATLLDSSQPTYLDGLGGEGDFFWTRKGGSLKIYAVGASSSPAASYTLDASDEIRASGNTLAILPYGYPAISVIDLGGGTPVRHDYATPTHYNTAYAARTSADWVFGNNRGAMLGELTSASPQRYALGAARSIAGSSTRIAVATSSGDILYFNAATRALEGEIPFSSSKLALSTDGTVLFAAADDQEYQYATDRTLRAYSLPSKNVLAEWPATFGQNSITPIDFEISDAGDIVGQVTRIFNGAQWQIERRVFRVDNTALWTESFARNNPDPEGIPVRLSSTGTRIGATYGELDSVSASNVYVNGALSGATNGWAVGWIDESHMLVNQYSSPNNFSRCIIVDTSGQQVAAPSLPEIRALQRVAVNTIYALNRNAIVDVQTGESIWSSAAPHLSVGAVAGQSVFFASGTTVRVEPR